MSFSRYPNYKDSGVEWWGDMPEGWGLFPAKRSFIRKKELNVGMKCENRLSLTLGGVVPRALDDLDGLQASEFETYQIFSADDLVFKLIDLQNIKTSRVGLVPEMGIMSPAYIRVEPNKAKITPKFAYWFFTNLYNRCIFNELGGGVRQTISSEELLLLPYPALPLAEQTQIAAFLDRETAKIDALVAEQRRLMELLKEKRQAVISHAVTRGLNPNVLMKPSGIEWLGDVPEDWEIMPLKRLIAEGTSISYGIVQPGDSLDEGVPFVQTTNMTRGSFDLENLQKTSPAIAAQFPRSCLKGGEVILGIRASIGAAHVVPEILAGANLSRGVARIVPNHQITSRYLVAYFGTGAVSQYWQLSKQGSTFNEVSIETVRELPVSVPPRKQQGAITSHLDTELGKFDTLTTEAQHAIDLLQERRTALISAAVTGQIDVRQLTEKQAA